MHLDRGAPANARILRWIGDASVGVAVIAWMAMVLKYQYGVPALGPYGVTADGLFLAGVAGFVLVRCVERWGVAPVRSTLLRIAFSVALLALMLVPAEIAARAVFPNAAAPVEPPESLNSLGFREREIGAKDRGRYRIIIIGDSFTFGNGIEERDRFSNLLQNFLGPDYDVLNLGHPGNNLPDHLDELKLALKFQPDFVLLQLYENDFETVEMATRRPRSYPLLPQELDTAIGSASLLYRLLLDAWVQLQQRVGLAESYTQYMARHLRDPGLRDARDTSAWLIQFIDGARAAGVADGGVFFPALYGLKAKGADYPFTYLNQRVSKIYFDEQTPYLDLLPDFQTVHDPSTLWVSRFDPHPNAKANHLAATAILNRFLSTWRQGLDAIHHRG